MASEIEGLEDGMGWDSMEIVESLDARLDAGSPVRHQRFQVSV